MFSFRSISLVATLALAAFSFAVPVENVGGGLDLMGRSTSNELLERTIGTTDEIISRGQLGVPDHFNICHATLVEIQPKLVAACKGTIEVTVVVGLLGEVLVALNLLVTSLRGLIGVSAGVYCLSGGIVVTLQVIAGIVCVLLQLVFDLLCVVIGLVVHAEISAVVVEIVGVLLIVVQLVLEIVVGLAPVLYLVVGGLLVDILLITASLNIGALVQICGLLHIVL